MERGRWSRGEQFPISAITQQNDHAWRWELAVTALKLSDHPGECSWIKLQPQNPSLSPFVCKHAEISQAPEQCLESEHCFKNVPCMQIHCYIKISHYIILKNLSSKIHSLPSSAIISIQLLEATQHKKILEANYKVLTANGWASQAVCYPQFFPVQCYF